MDVQQKIFEKIANDTVSEAVVAQIEHLILNGVLKGGQKLPSERDLSELMEVSRPKVRDAIKVLEERQLLTVRHGEGTFIAPLTGTALSPAMVDLISRHSGAFYDYLEFRREVEGYAAFMAAQRATVEDDEIIRRLIGKMEAAHSNPDPAEEASIDVSFHSAVVDAAHNSILVHIMSSIYELMRRGIFYNREFLYRRGDGRDLLLEQHRAIAEAIVDRDPEAAGAAAEAHMDFVKTSFSLGDSENIRRNSARKRLLLLDGFGLSDMPAGRKRRE